MSVFKPKNATYWYIDITDERGGRLKRSTGTKDKDEAEAYERAEQANRPASGPSTNSAMVVPIRSTKPATDG